MYLRTFERIVENQGGNEFRVEQRLGRLNAVSMLGLSSFSLWGLYKLGRSRGSQYLYKMLQG